MPKGRNPGFKPGDHWFICDVCGFAYRQSEGRERWDGASVCKHDWEQRHPQDFLKARDEQTAARGLVRSDPEPTYIEDTGEVTQDDL